MYFNIFDSRGSLPHFISSQPKAPGPPCSCFSFGRGKSIRQVGFQVKQPSTALIQQTKRHQATSSDVKRRQATSSDATGQIRQIRQIRQVRQVRHHSGGLFVVRLWTRRLQRCVEVLDAMQVPAWLRKPFSTSYMSPKKKVLLHIYHILLLCIACME